jgi:hypothetical protein
MNEPHDPVDPLDPADPLLGIEARLQKLSPAELPTYVAARLATANPARRVVQSSWRWIAITAAAASVAIATAWFARTPPTPDAGANIAAQEITPDDLRIYSPVATRNLLINAREVGLIEPPNSPPIRLVRCLWLDDSTYRADTDGHEIAVTRAHEQIIPVVLEVY